MPLNNDQWNDFTSLMLQGAIRSEQNAIQLIDSFVRPGKPKGGK